MPNLNYTFERNLANLGIITEQEIKHLFTPTASCAENLFFRDGEENLHTSLIIMIYLYTHYVMKNSVCKGGHPVEQRERTSFRAYSCRFTLILPDSWVLKQPGSWEKQRCLLPNCWGCSPSSRLLLHRLLGTSEGCFVHSWLILTLSFISWWLFHAAPSSLLSYLRHSTRIFSKGRAEP